MVEIERLHFEYGEKAILREIGAEFLPQSVTGVIGPNGAGKSTLIKCMAKLLKPKGGVIRIEGQNIQSIQNRELAKLQAYVPQNGSVTFPLSVREFVALGRKPYVEWSLAASDWAIIQETMDYLGISGMAGRYLDEVSGGERQRVMLARALVQQPKVLLLDEPTSALDIRHQLEVMELLRQIAAERGCAVVLVMHDLQLVARYCDRVLLLKNGDIYASGTPDETITPESIQAVYGIRAEILQTKAGMQIVPLESIHEESGESRCITE